MARPFRLGPLLFAILLLPLAALRAADGTELPEDAPEAFRKNYVVVAGTASPDGRYAAIIPRSEYFQAHEKEAKNYLVALAPFGLIAPLPTKYPTFVGQSHGGLALLWMSDSSAVIFSLEGKWGPQDVFVARLEGGKVTRLTDLGARLRALLGPALARTKAASYNDKFLFVFESEYEPVTFSSKGTVIVDIIGNTNPKAADERGSAKARLRAEFDPATEKFLRQKVTRGSG